MKILYNARIHTLNPDFPDASALVINEGRITAVGGKELLESYPGAEKRDLAGCTVLPGLTDAHIHLQLYSLNLEKIDCETDSKEECLRRVTEAAHRVLPGEWLLGHGWNQNNWDGAWPTAEELDRVVPNHPVYLTAKSLHAGWANSLALRKAKVRNSTRNPKDGVIQRDERGKPTGILLENAMKLVEKILPEPRVNTLVEIFKDAIKKLNSMGITGIHDFDRAPCMRALQILSKSGELHLRAVKSIPREDLDLALLAHMRTGAGDDFLRFGSLKLFADGALGPRTGAMLEVYTGDPQNYGLLLLDSEEILELGMKAARGGISLAVHAIGDRANREVLDGFSKLREYEQRNQLPALRHRIEHVQVIHPQDAPRLAELGLTASMQPIHVISDMRMADVSWGERSKLAYAWRTQLNHGAVLAFGSDAPVESPNPFLGLRAALTRRCQDGYPGVDGWQPQERLTFAEALAGFTTGPAFAAGREEQLGRLEAGYLADLIILEKDPFTCDPDALVEMRPLATMVGGEWVWEE